MASNLINKLIVAISSRALFDLDESHQVYERDGIEAYAQYQITNETQPLQPGMAFQMVKKLLALRTADDEPLVEVVLISRNSADTGLRIFNSIQHHQLPISRAAFTQGESPFQYIGAFGAHLFLSANTEDVARALNAGCAAATIIPGHHHNNDEIELRIAFDGDAVLFSDDSEKIFQQAGLSAFQQNESSSANEPLPAGPFKGFLQALHHVQSQFPANTCPIRTALVTARAAPAHERVIRTLRSWQIRIDEALFLGGLSKGEFLKAFGADFFFDDQKAHCDQASQHVATGHVPHGIMNTK